MNTYISILYTVIRYYNIIYFYLLDNEENGHEDITPLKYVTVPIIMYFIFFLVKFKMVECLSLIFTYYYNIYFLISMSTPRSSYLKYNSHLLIS